MELCVSICVPRELALHISKQYEEIPVCAHEAKWRSKWCGSFFSNSNSKRVYYLAYFTVQTSSDCGKSNFPTVNVQGLSSVYSALVVDCKIPTFVQRWVYNRPNVLSTVEIVYCAPRAKTGFCASRTKLSPEAKPRNFQLYTRHKRSFLLEVHILFCLAAEQKRVFAFKNIQSGFEVIDVLLVAICYLSFLWAKLS